MVVCFLALGITLSVSFSKGLRELSCRNTPALERITNVKLHTETLIDDTLCYGFVLC